MRWNVIFIVALSGYLFGAIPFTKLIRRLFKVSKEAPDIEIPISGTNETYRVTATGAVTASMELGTRGGCIVAILDMLKVALPTLVSRIIFEEPIYFLITATAGMIGHIWPVFNRFKGGRGVSSVYGALLVIDWLGAFAVAAGGLLIGIFIFRDFLLAYVAGLWLLIPWMWLRYNDWSYFYFAIAINIIFIVAMIPDIKQYLRFKKMGKADVDTVMEMTPMGRGMRRMMELLKIRRK